VAKHDRFARAPILIIDFRAVAGLDRGHSVSPSDTHVKMRVD
jgi:hypothetical protein